ncbi:hypothetical protein IW261DRAFT_1529940 [Armillaria novae-zelandiae]|uniref:C2H2-type domain-containing protein n=1 Tax=Armillaria novae-zelandiae TaxID=153914 RepID=A0AA39TWE3_9AGAR|nr:hypothetical protein IW261DRAFT_1529940 [Armillaria novae-zelandiae]
MAQAPSLPPLDFRTFSIAGALMTSPAPTPSIAQYGPTESGTVRIEYSLMPDGYETIPSHESVPDCKKGLTLDASYNSYYQCKIDSVHLVCPLCSQDILGRKIRQHMRENHRGYCRGERIKCIACGSLAREMNAKSYPDHVLEKHCLLSVLCPHCGESFTREESVKRHCISFCKRLIQDRPQ